MIKGRYISYAQYLKHQKSLRKAGVACDDLSDGMALDIGDPPQPQSSDEPSRASKRLRTHHNRDNEVDFYLRQLHSIKARLGTISTEKLPGSVVFSPSSTSGCLQLDVLAAENQEILSLERWLSELRPFLQNSPLRQQSRRVNLLSTVLLRSLARVEQDIKVWMD
ncbi:hypothetical protein ONZ45_g15177 [Pleurotus djamor]|nr:hypothetical protein ONZ45_g15177 [Pleurotus djamor]